MSVIALRPKYYTSWIVHQKCHNCGEEYMGTDLMVAREIPKGEAFSPLPADGILFDIPVVKKETRRDVAYCPMCIDKAERHALPAPPKQQVVGRRPAEPVALANPDAQALLKTLGLI